MIVEPDFLDHWKTRMLINLTGDPAAPVMILRLWAHCQYRKASKFRGYTPDTLKAICYWTREADKLEEILLACRFIDKSGDVTTVHDWHAVNASLVKNWVNGRKNAKRYPKHTQDIPKGGAIEKRREDREEKIEGTPAPKSRVATDDLEWLAELRADPAYKGIDVAREYAKSVRWCKENRRQPTRKFFINWLNKADRHLDVKFKPASTTLKVLPSRPPELTDEQIAKNKAVIAETVGKLTASMNVRGA